MVLYAPAVATPAQQPGQTVGAATPPINPVPGSWMHGLWDYGKAALGDLGRGVIDYYRDDLLANFTGQPDPVTVDPPPVDQNSDRAFNPAAFAKENIGIVAGGAAAVLGVILLAVR